MSNLAVEYFRSVPRYLGARTLGKRAPGLVSGPFAALRLATLKDPEQFPGQKPSVFAQ